MQIFAVNIEILYFYFSVASSEMGNMSNLSHSHVNVSLKIFV